MQDQIAKIKSLLQFKDDTRSVKTKKNIILLFILNGFNFISLLLIVPLTLDYLGAAEYGIWLTLSSILLWIGYLDFGIGNGLRNKLAEALANNDKKKAKIYVSTAYTIFSGAVAGLYIIFFIGYRFIDWASILNSPPGLNEEIFDLVFYVFTFFIIQFILKLIASIINADQRPAVNGLLSAVINLSTVLFIFILTLTTEGSLFFLSTGSSIIPAAVFLIASIILFSKQFKDFSPSFKFIDLKYSKDLFGLGAKFFIIQASGLIVFATDNLIITQIFGPEEVTVYNIAYKYFYLIPLVLNVFLTPMWSAYTDAYAKNDMDWIKNAMKKMQRIWMILSAAIIFMILISDFIYRIWIGDEIIIPFSLSLSMGVFVIILNWTNIFAYFLNGTGKITLQFYNAIFIAVINIPLSILFAKELNFGITGVIIGTIVSLLFGSLWAPIQYYKIINKKDFGIWGK